MSEKYRLWFQSNDNPNFVFQQPTVVIHYTEKKLAEFVLNYRNISPNFKYTFFILNWKHNINFFRYFPEGRWSFFGLTCGFCYSRFIFFSKMAQRKLKLKHCLKLNLLREGEKVITLLQTPFKIKYFLFIFTFLLHLLIYRFIVFFIFSSSLLTLFGRAIQKLRM